MLQTTLWQRLEGLGMVGGSLLLYTATAADWWLFALILAPDLAIAGYLLGKQKGQLFYNVAHTYAVPLLLAGVGYGVGNDLLLALSLIWVAHIGFDRALGYGLKEPAGFTYTHLGRIGGTQQQETTGALPAEV